MSEEHVSRREALTGGAAAIAGVGAALAVSAVASEARADNASDATALNTVRTKAYTIVRAYDQAIGYLMPMAEGATAAALLTHFRQQHRDHAERIATQVTALGGTPVGENTVLPPTAPTGFTLSTGNYLKWAANLERQTAVANIALLNNIGSKDAAELVAGIVGTQTQHFIVLYLLVRGVAQPGPMAASMLNQIVPRAFVNVEAAAAASLTSVANLPFSP